MFLIFSFILWIVAAALALTAGGLPGGGLGGASAIVAILSIVFAALSFVAKKTTAGTLLLVLVNLIILYFEIGNFFH